MITYGIVLFHTTSSAFRAEKVLKKAGLDCEFIPTPRQFSSDCGIAARFDWNKSNAVADALNAARVEVAGIRGLAADS